MPPTRTDIPPSSTSTRAPIVPRRSGEIPSRPSQGAKRTAAVTRANAKERRRLRLRARLKALGLLVVIAALSAGVLALAHSSLLAARNLVLSGTTPYSPAEIRQAAGITVKTPLVDIEDRASARAIERLPWVKSASVLRQLPDTVRVRLSERTAAAVVEAKESGKPVFWLVDGDGRVLGSVARSGLVALRGPVGSLVPGVTLDPEGRWAAEVAAASPPSLIAQTAGITVNSDSQVAMLMRSGSKALLGGPTQLPAKLVALATMLRDAQIKGGTIIDVRVPQFPTLTQSQSGA
jgi:cell division protein FtsQ